MNVTLIVEKGEGQTLGQEVVLPTSETVVGRMKECGVRIASNDVSRRHCILRLQNGFLVVEDLASLNGTYVNSQRVFGRHVVYPNDELEVGPLTFRVQYELVPEMLEHGSPASPEAIPVHEGNTLSSAETATLGIRTLRTSLSRPSSRGEKRDVAVEVNTDGGSETIEQPVVTLASSQN